VTAANAFGDTVRYTAFLAALAGIYIGVDEGIAAAVGKDRCVAAAPLEIPTRRFTTQHAAGWICLQNGVCGRDTMELSSSKAAASLLPDSSRALFGL
jgi:hypothetical protein